MRLETFHVSGFRSVKSAVLVDCGGFNVLIGKNNAGKSNLLLALDSFFGCIKGGQPVTLNPPIGQTIDRFGGTCEGLIELSLGFELSLAERDAVLQEIVSIAPQVKNTVEGIDPTLRLKISVCIPAGVPAFAYVRQLALCSKESCAVRSQPVSRTILQIGDVAAKELADRAKRIALHEEEANFLRRYTEDMPPLDAEDWARYRTEMMSSTRRYRTHFSTNAPPSNEVQRKLEEVVKKSETLASFREAIASLASSILEEASSLKGEPLKARVESLSGQESSIPEYALKLLARIADTKVLYLTERRETIGRREAAQLLDLKVRRGGPEKFRYIQDTVNALLGVEIDAFKSDTQPSRNARNEAMPAELDVDRFLVQVNGAGIREALRIVLDYEFEKPQLLLVEEPEIHLHPALETSMMRHLKNVSLDGNCQVFITTHSTNFLDTAEMQNIFLVSHDESTSVSLLNIADAEVTIPNELGIRLSSLFMFDRLVFVEGPSDEDVIREWATLLRQNLAHASVGFVPMGGVRNLAHFSTEKIITLLTRRRVRMWFVLDRDERDESEINKLTQTLGNQAILHVLERREIENYLLAPKAISAFIALKKTLAGDKDAVGPDPNEIQAVLSKTADDLKQNTIERRIARLVSTPVHLDRRALLDGASGAFSERLLAQLTQQRTKLDELAAGLGALTTQQEELIARQWERQKFEIVAGDMLLDAVCRHFGVRFNKERDSARVAALMQADEIPPEITRLIKEIARV